MPVKTNRPNVLISEYFHVSIYGGGRKRRGKKIVFTLQRLDWSSDVRTDKS